MCASWGVPVAIVGQEEPWEETEEPWTLAMLRVELRSAA